MAEARRDIVALDARGAHVVIVEGRFYDHLNDMLVAGAIRAIRAAGATHEIVTVPGALEIPIAISMLVEAAAAGRQRCDAVVALGCVIRGATTHYEIVSNESARALLDVANRHRLAFGNGILTVENEGQALERADPERMDKGGDAARAALSLLTLQRRLAADPLRSVS